MKKLILTVISIVSLSQAVSADPRSDFYSAALVSNKAAIVGRVDAQLAKKGLSIKEFPAEPQFEINQIDCTLIPGDCDTTVYISNDKYACRARIATIAGRTEALDQLTCIIRN